MRGGSVNMKVSSTPLKGHGHHVVIALSYVTFYMKVKYYEFNQSAFDLFDS